MNLHTDPSPQYPVRSTPQTLTPVRHKTAVIDVAEMLHRAHEGLEGSWLRVMERILRNGISDDQATVIPVAELR